MNLVLKILAGDAGQGMAEYALILMLLALAVIIGLSNLGKAIAGAFSDPSLQDALK